MEMGTPAQRMPEGFAPRFMYAHHVRRPHARTHMAAGRKTTAARITRT